MVRPPVSYGSTVKLASQPNEIIKEAKERSAHMLEPLAKQSTTLPTQEMPATRRRPMESRSDPTVLYLHPDGKYELKRYALARGSKVKVHDLIMEAVEEWAERHGIAAPFRVPSERLRRTP